MGNDKQLTNIYWNPLRVPFYLLRITPAEGLSAPFLEITDADDAEQAIGATFVVVPDTDWPDRPSTGFLERWRFLFRCLSQYF